VKDEKENSTSMGSKGRISVKTSAETGSTGNKSLIDTVPAPEGSGYSDPEKLPAEEKLNMLYRVTAGLAEQLEKSRISEYSELLHSPLRLIWLNVLSGIARGVGIALGFTFFAATIIYVLQVLGALNLPIIGDYIADIVRIVQHQLELKTF